jgi:hypothetical protein
VHNQEAKAANKKKRLFIVAVAETPFGSPFGHP